SRLVNVEAVSAANAGVRVDIDLRSQSDGFVITGNALTQFIFGSSGNDTIVGFPLVVDGGGGIDTLVLNASLNGSNDSNLVNVERITAAGVSAAVTINLQAQSEGFAVTGSGFNDVIVGGAGADSISAGAGDDIIGGFVGADSVDGGAGSDTIRVLATSA